MGWRSKICRIAGAATLIAYSATAGMAQDALPDPAPQQKLSESILERSLSAAAIIETADVRDADDDAVGKVEDFIVGPDGRIESMIIATDELLGLGESYFTYPLKDADIDDYREIRIKADADEIERLQKAEPVPEPAGNDSWRLSELIGDIARTRDNKEYGRLSDVLFSPEGEITAVVIMPESETVRTRGYAIPYFGASEGFDPLAEYYAIPHELEELSRLGIELPETVGRAVSDHGAGNETGQPASMEADAAGQAQGGLSPGQEEEITTADRPQD